MTVNLVYNALLLCCESAGITFGLRRPRPRSQVVLIVLSQPLIAAVLALLLGENVFGAMRLLAFGVFIHLPLLMLTFGVLLARRDRVALVLACVLSATVLAIGWDAFLIEPHALQVTRVHLSSSKLTRHLRIAVVSDLQMRQLGAYEKAALQRTLAEKPDLILLPGDYVQADDASSQTRVSRELGAYLSNLRFSAPLGVFAVEGNVDGPEWPAIFEPIQAETFSVSRSVKRAELRITGLTLRDSFNSSLIVPPRTEQFQIVFGHAPDFALGRVEADLLIAGHTHGGQVRLPWIGPLLTLSAVPNAWAAGKTDLGHGRTLLVSRGIGLERGYAPELRFRCLPELMIIDLEPIP